LSSGRAHVDHVKFGVSDYAASKAFFLRALAPLGVTAVAEGVPTCGIELVRPDGNVCHEPEAS
jgi:catechol 2,3-dioxygenase-like lactoylglutathione lyase family enzyme